MSSQPSTICATPLQRGSGEPPGGPPVEAGARLPVGALLALAATAALILMTELLPIGLLAPMSAALHQSPGRTGFLASAYAAAAIVGAIPLTAVTRSLPRRSLLVGLLAGFAVVNVVTALSSTYGVTLGARVVGGLLGGLVWSMLAGYAARLVSVEQRGRAISLALAGGTVALAMGVPAGTALAGWVGWRATFGLVGAIATGVLIWVRLGVPFVSGADSGRTASLGVVVRVRGVRTVLLVTALFVLGHQMTYTYLAVLSRDAGLRDAAPVLLVFGLAGIAGIWTTGVLADRHLRPAVLTSIGLVALSLVALGPASAHPLGLFVTVAVWGLAFGGVPTLLLTTLIRAAGPANEDTATSLQTTVYNVGVAGGAFVGGLVLDRSGAGSLPWSAVPFIVVAGSLVVVGRRTFTSRPVPGASRLQDD
jgi:predicted MFS family arabinose efflux permease